jgi:hypothetical protein
VTRFLLTHAKTDDGDRLSSLLSVANAAVARASGGRPFQIVLGRDFFEARFKSSGSWDAWCEEAATGVDYATRLPHFNGFLVPTTRFGAGTGRILQRALAVRKPCFVFRGDSTVARVQTVTLVERGDWQTGYSAQIGEYT